MPSFHLSTANDAVADPTARAQADVKCVESVTPPKPDIVEPSVPDDVEAFGPDDLESFGPDDLEPSEPDITTSDVIESLEPGLVEQFDPEFDSDGIDDSIWVDLFVTLDLKMVNTVVFPARTAEHYKRLLIYSVVSFHLGVYVGVILYPSISKALRRFLN